MLPEASIQPQRVVEHEAFRLMNGKFGKWSDIAAAIGMNGQDAG